MEIIKDIDQGTEEWFALRRGLVTSSNFDKVMAKGRGNAPSKTRESYMMNLAFERMNDKNAPDDHKTIWMDRGNEIEDQARANYELITGHEVEQIAFIKIGDDIGSSTDGLIDHDGVLEIKCPKHTTHMKYILEPESLYKEYRKQVQGELWVSGREWADICSYHPDFVGDKDLVIYRVERDNKFISEIKIAVNDFVSDLHQLIEKLEKKS